MHVLCGERKTQFPFAAATGTQIFVPVLAGVRCMVSLRQCRSSHCRSCQYGAKSGGDSVDDEAEDISSTTTSTIATETTTTAAAGVSAASGGGKLQSSSGISSRGQFCYRDSARQVVKLYNRSLLQDGYNRGDGNAAGGSALMYGKYGSCANVVDTMRKFLCVKKTKQQLQRLI